MRVAVYDFRPDEEKYFARFSREYGQEIVPLKATPYMDTVHLADGCDALSIITSSPITPEMLDEYKKMGIRLISTRTIGYEHIDYKYAAKIGIAAANISYPPEGVAEYAIMMMLMALRRIKHLMYRNLGQDYTMKDMCGRQLNELTVGVIGTGAIGSTVVKDLQGFGCRILASSRHEKDELKGMCEYVGLDTLLGESDVVSLHLASDRSTYHIINKDTLARMKDGAVLVNTARGSLVDSAALIEALESGKVSAAALDLVEGDREIYYRDQKYKMVLNHEMAILNQMPNVLMLSHMAFYTEEAVRAMVQNSLLSCKLFEEGKPIPWRVN